MPRYHPGLTSARRGRTAHTPLATDTYVITTGTETALAKRFYHIAFELGMKPREFIRDLSEVGLSVGNQMVIVPPELEARIHQVFDQLHPSEEAQAAAAAEADVAPTAPTEAPYAPESERIAGGLVAELPDHQVEKEDEGGEATPEVVLLPSATFRSSASERCE